ncbi:MAG: metal-dependent hydrolase [Planctomycetes bacterium]|nr:metal-dependent hydrolase [Planctomycetota bacterium]
MSTFLGHALVGVGLAAVGLGRAKSPLLRHPLLWMAGAFLGVLPDFDIVVFRFFGHAWAPSGHRGPSHTLGAALAVALALAGVGALFRARLTDIGRICGTAFAIVYTHALMDALCGAGRGVALAWPFSDVAWLSPVRLLPGAAWSRAVPDLVELFGTAHNLSVLGGEMLIFGPPALAAAVWAHLGSRRESERGELTGEND